MIGCNASSNNLIESMLSRIFNAFNCNIPVLVSIFHPTLENPHPYYYCYSSDMSF